MQQTSCSLINSPIYKAYQYLYYDKNCYPFYNCFAVAAGFSYIHCPILEHWITTEISFDEEVRIFDSLFSNKVKKRIASIIKTKLKKLSSNKTQVTVAYLPLLLLWIHAMELTQLYSNKHELRSHFLKRLQEGNIKPFTTKPIAKKKHLLQTLKIYCKCRLPYVLEHKIKK